MKLPVVKISAINALMEFDVWLTPTLGEIRDTERFRKEMESAVRIFEVLGKKTDKFSFKMKPDIRKIAEAVELEIASGDKKYAIKFLTSIADLVYLVTGKSDNNCKCQLPIYLRQVNIFNKMPVVKNSAVEFQNWPRSIKAEQFMKIVAELSMHPDMQTELIRVFFEFILSDEAYVSQLWAIGNCYYSLKPFSKEKSLLSPLVIFKIRGSVTASGGHEPEQMLRRMMIDWGMKQGVDFNNDDVVISPPAAKKAGRTKIRKYDFLLPYKSTTWQSGLFIQCQFYAGDSGSVSHKNVDQTTSTRSYTTKHFSHARFCEFVDGAGYFASLNGDLKTLLQMANTHSFFQIKSAPIRLRRELQQIGYLTPLEIEHALYCSGGDKKCSVTMLVLDGYSNTEIERVFSWMLEEAHVFFDGEKYTVSKKRSVMSRRYFILDVIAIHGATLSEQQNKGYILVPGYGPFYGLKLKDLPPLILKHASLLTPEINDTTTFLADLEWLVEKGYIMTS
jgi:hypothetical protein